MQKDRWRSELTEGEALRLKRFDQQIAMQTTAVDANPDNHDLVAMLALLKYKRYLLQSKAAQRLKRRKPDAKPTSRVKATRSLVAA